VTVLDNLSSVDGVDKGSILESVYFLENESSFLKEFCSSFFRCLEKVGFSSESLFMKVFVNILECNCCLSFRDL